MESPVLVQDKASLLKAIGKFCDELEYQHGNKHRIGELMTVVDKCLFYNKFSENHDDQKFHIYIKRFLGQVICVCEQSLMFFICSEISNSVQARPLAAITLQLFHEKHYTGKVYIQERALQLTKEEVNISFNNLQDLFVKRYDQTVGAHMLDFGVSMFSAFENCITHIAEFYQDEMTEKYMLSRAKKYSKYLKKYESSTSEEDKKNWISKMRNVPGDFLSFPDKFNFVMNKVKSNYSRDYKEDCKLIDFLRASRNTVHNGGVHKGNTLGFTYEDISHQLVKNKAQSHNDYNDFIKLCAVLVDIYCAIAASLNGGLEQEESMKLECLIRLKAVGVEINGIETLYQYLKTENWRTQLIFCGSIVRREVVSFTVKSSYNPTSISAILRQYGFDDKSIDRFIGNGLKVVD